MSPDESLLTMLNAVTPFQDRSSEWLLQDTSGTKVLIPLGI
jgi:hypothetical protein